MRIVVATADFVAVGFNIPVAEFFPARDLARHEELRRLGPDLLSEDFDEDEALRRIQGRPAETIADVLLNQRVVAGIGNVYKSEVLFACRINPFVRAGDLGHRGAEGPARDRATPAARQRPLLAGTDDDLRGLSPDDRPRQPGRTPVGLRPCRSTVPALRRAGEDRQTRRGCEAHLLVPEVPGRGGDDHSSSGLSRATRRVNPGGASGFHRFTSPDPSPTTHDLSASSGPPCFSGHAPRPRRSTGTTWCLPGWLTGPEICQLEDGGCQVLFRTQRARLLGVPNAALGILLYVILAAGLIAGAPVLLLWVLTWPAVAMSAFLGYGLIVNHRQCRICWTGHVANAVLFVALGYLAIGIVG